MPTFADSPKTLTPRQQRFVVAYVACGNASKAAQEAGYSDAKNEGYRLVHRSHIQVAIQKRMKQVLSTQENALTPKQLAKRRTCSLMTTLEEDNKQSRVQLAWNIEEVQEVTNTMRQRNQGETEHYVSVAIVEEQQVSDVLPALQPLAEPHSPLYCPSNVKQILPVTLGNIPKPAAVGQGFIPLSESLISMPAVVVQSAFSVEQRRMTVPYTPDLTPRRLEAAQRLWELGQTVLDRQSLAFQQARHELIDVIPSFSTSAEIIEWARGEVEAQSKASS